ncbi:thioesterase superfamily protein [Jatrophihabitans sp. GAS493]|nr:thioesterase superfamily protein [Jatrophihabitans sp. GAS493]
MTQKLDVRSGANAEPSNGVNDGLVPVYRPTTLTPDALREQDEVYGALTQAVRGLNEAQLRTEVDPDLVRVVTAQIESITARLLVRARAASFGLELGHDGGAREHGNPVLGLRNPFAAALGENAMFWGEKDAYAELELGPLYEGPPGLVHGGVLALLLDQLFTEAAAAAGMPAMTVNLVVNYRRPTPLGTVGMRAWLESIDGAKRRLKATVYDPEGNVTTESECLLVLPKAIEAGNLWPKRPPRPR